VQKWTRVLRLINFTSTISSTHYIVGAGWPEDWLKAWCDWKAQTNRKARMNVTWFQRRRLINDYRSCQI
jgi:hypothetical protein